MVPREAQLAQLRGRIDGVHPILARNDHFCCHAAEEAMLDDSDHGLQLGGGGVGVGERAIEEDVYNVVPVVRQRRRLSVRLVGGSRAQPQLGRAARERGQRTDVAQRARVAEGRHLDGHGEGGTERVAELRLIYDDDELVRTYLHHLLAQQSAAAALDEVETLVDRVRAVDRDVDLWVRVERDERDAQRLGLLLCAHRRRYRDDPVELARRQLFPEPLDRKVRSRACAESHNHSRAHVRINRAVARFPLQLVLRTQLPWFNHCCWCCSGR
mmetsp:Transcript_49870/g.106593  ORF Transcript_49870/g.106593 Transcript_49870/m.106593 type:complete len:270 (-) Transcript_49870:745-1554(-)